MSLEEKLKATLSGNDRSESKSNKSSSGTDKKPVPTRAEIKAKLLSMIAENTGLSGKHDYHTGHHALIEVTFSDQEFKKSLDVVVDKIMFIFHSEESIGQA